MVVTAIGEGTASDMDLGDWLLEEGKVTQETYNTRQQEAKELLGV